MGRPSLRADPRLLPQVFVKHRPQHELARSRGISQQAFSRRFLRELDRQLRTKSHPIGDIGPAVLLCDGDWVQFEQGRRVLYLMALRPVNGNQAVFLDPVLLPGGEGKLSWETALATIPGRLRSQIRAIVVDDFGGCTNIAEDNGWTLQLCHWHFLAQLERRLGLKRKRAVADRSLRFEAYRLAKAALEAGCPTRLEATIRRLAVIYSQPGLHWKYRNLLRQFIRRIAHYRAFRNHPHLRLPRTTGAAESMVRIISDLRRRARGIKTARALKLWVTNYIRMRPMVECNPARKSTN